LFNNVVDGFSQVISDLKHPLFAKQDGVSHAVNDLKNIPAGTIIKLDMEFEEPDKPCVKCTFDVKENGTPPKFREYKSYTDASQIPLPQFLNYMNGITKLSELKYIFNAKKLTTEQAKDGMKEFFVKNYDTIWTAGQPKGFFDGLKLKNGTVVDDKLLFKEYLSEIKSSNSLFDFVDSI